MERLLAKSRQDGDCIVWTGSRNRAGYGRIRVNGQVLLTHRAAWIATHGQPPEDAPLVLHRCDNPPCFRLEHLYAGTTSDNTRDTVVRGRASVGILTGRKHWALMAPAADRPAIVGVHVDPEFMACEVDRRARVWLTPNGWLRWALDDTRKPAALPEEWVFRGLQDADLDDEAWLLAVLDRRGMIWQPFSRMAEANTSLTGYAPIDLPQVDDPAATMHIADIRAYLVLLRDMAAGCLQGQLGGVVLDGLQPGMHPFGLLREVQNAAAGHPAYTPALVDLYEAGCAQVFMAINENAPAKRCANETCGRVFYRKVAETRYGQRRKHGVKYCSGACQSAQQQRARRRRQAATIDT
jgi:HNH endonuclease